MSWLRSRARRVRGFGRIVVAVVLTSVALATAIAYWAERLGYVGVAVVFGLITLGLAVIILLPEPLWIRVTGANPVADDLGRLHEEGIVLRQQLPWVPDTDAQPLDEWEQRAEDWSNRVLRFLDSSAPRWKGVFLSNVTGFRTTTSGYDRASRFRNYLDDRLERLSQIMAAIGGRLHNRS